MDGLPDEPEGDAGKRKKGAGLETRLEA